MNFLIVVSRVLQNVPFLLRKKQIHVEVCLDGQKVEKDAGKDSPDSLCTIKVSESREKTSKDSVEEIKGKVKDGVQLIKSENEERK